MTEKFDFKLVLDILLTLLLLFLMGFQFWGEIPHEVAGTSMFILFIAHHCLNSYWHKRLFNGRYTPLRILTLVIDLLLVITMLMLMYSGIVLSRHVFAFLSIKSGFVLSGKLHLLGAYWGFILMSLHLGLHWQMVWGKIISRLHFNPSNAQNKLLLGLATLFAVYGIYVFYSRDFLASLLLENEFAFMDYAEPKIAFYCDYLAVMALGIFLAHYAGRLCQHK